MMESESEETQLGIAIVGAGGHGRVAMECLELSGLLLGEVAFFDDRWETLSQVDGVPVCGPIAALAVDARFETVFVGIGDNRARRRITADLAAAGKRFLTAIHPKTTISSRADLGEGAIAVAGTVVNRDARVGRGAILNTLCSVGHDCRIGDFAQISPGVNLGGGAVIEEGACLGIGAMVAPLAHVGAWTVVGAGSVVLKDLPSGWFCYGAPARPIRPMRVDELPADVTPAVV